MSSTVLVINSGSSSLKFQLVEPVAGMSRAAGIVERIGERSSPVADHAQALHRAFKMLAEDGIDLQTCGLVAVGHRVVHGGTEFHQPTLLDDTVIGKLEELSALAPLHNRRRYWASRWHADCWPMSRTSRCSIRPFSMTCPRRRDLCHRPRRRRQMAYPPLRISWHFTPIRQRAGRRLPGPPARRFESDCAASG